MEGENQTAGVKRRRQQVCGCTWHIQAEHTHKNPHSLPSQGPRIVMGPGVVPFPPPWAWHCHCAGSFQGSSKPSSLKVSGGNCWVFWVQLKQKGCMCRIGRLNTQGPPCSGWGCVPHALLMKGRYVHITIPPARMHACMEAPPPPKGKDRGSSSEQDRRWTLASFNHTDLFFPIRLQLVPRPETTCMILADVCPPDT